MKQTNNDTDLTLSTKDFAQTARTKLFKFDEIFKSNAKKSVDKTELFLQQLKNEGFTDKEIEYARKSIRETMIKSFAKLSDDPEMWHTCIDNIFSK